MSYGFKEFSIEVLTKVNKPLGKMDIWKKGVEFGFDKKLDSQGKTPWCSIGAQIYSEIKKKGNKSSFKQVSKRPSLFALSNQSIDEKEISNAIMHIEKIDTEKTTEKYERKFSHGNFI